ncbi:Pericentrin, partial [Varanus komodoensis]
MHKHLPDDYRDLTWVNQMEASKLTYEWVITARQHIDCDAKAMLMNHVLSELSAMTCLSWVTLHSIAHSFIELRKPLCHDKAVIHEGEEELSSPIESNRLNLKVAISKQNIVADIYYHPRSQKEDKDLAFEKQLASISKKNDVVIMGDFNFPNICWETNSAKHDPSKRFLTWVADNFPQQKVEEDTSSDLVLQLNWKKPETTIYQDGNVMAYLQHSGIFPDVTEPGMKEKDFFSQQLKNVLSMVYEESYKILVLSEKPLPIENDKNVQQAPSEVKWQREKQTLLDIVQSLKDYLNKISHKEKQENSSFFDWRGKLLQAVECILEKEQNTLQGYLQSHFHNSGSGDTGALVKKLEYIVEQQEHQQTLVLEHLLSSDRNSLLAEIQDLKAQLRLTHLQNQEKLQQLQETLIDTENHGSKQEHQLRRQVELLEYKLQEEKLIASNLQDSLQSEQDKASKIHELLKEEHTAIVNLKSELCESKQTNEKLEKALEELQKEVIKYRSALEMKEKGITAVFQDLQNEQQELQTMLDERQHQHKIREDESSRAIEHRRPNSVIIKSMQGQSQREHLTPVKQEANLLDGMA